MRLSFVCATCSRPVRRVTSPAQLRAQGPPRYCGRACYGQAQRQAAAARRATAPVALVMSCAVCGAVLGRYRRLVCARGCGAVVCRSRDSRRQHRCKAVHAAECGEGS
jgi:hypothetical protein